MLVGNIHGSRNITNNDFWSNENSTVRYNISINTNLPTIYNKRNSNEKIKILKSNNNIRVVLVGNEKTKTLKKDK
tara:strand:- start:769 stop:993 length:225 start_codon:yes stop_codon:yes gene_type:complete